MSYQLFLVQIRLGWVHTLNLIKQFDNKYLYTVAKRSLIIQKFKQFLRGFYAVYFCY
jgi:hypothetical protein